MKLGGGFDAIDAVPPLDDIHVDFQRPSLAPEQFLQAGEVDFESFAEPARNDVGPRPKKNVLGGLLGDRRAAPNALAALISLKGVEDGFEVETVVLAVEIVLG